MIDIKNVSKTYGEKTVLFPLDLKLAAEQTHVILGSSGCGKSTLFRILMGLIPASTGEVKMNGVAMNPQTQKELVRQMGYVVQDSGLFPHLTGFDNVSLLMKTLGHSRSRINERVEELAGLVKLDLSLFSKFPNSLSGGQKQRLGIVRALMLDPKIILLDEPLGALDPIVRADLQNEMKRIFNTLKKTVLIITHDLGEAASFGHTISLFDQGRLIQHGTFPDLAKRPATPFVTEFLNAQRPPREVLENL
ncbi:MAG: ATP-binding cassette domain-containing protein [Cryobacterium sp.]|nr:ATP-binding cassette domain-containing protein [Oligoflexia bacterium]